MKVVTLKLTTKELELLTTLVADQLFRKEFIDPKIPGFKSNAEDMSIGKALMARLRLMLDPVSVKRSATTRVNDASSRVTSAGQAG
jgi:hypothetical protein